MVDEVVRRFQQAVSMGNLVISISLRLEVIDKSCEWRSTVILEVHDRVSSGCGP